MADLAQLEEQIVSLSLLEAAALVKKLEERLGVSAAAAAPVAVAGGGGAAAAPAAEEKTEFQVILKDFRRQQDQHHQGSTRSYLARPEGSQGPGRRRPQGAEGERDQGRGRGHQEEVRRRRHHRNQVVGTRTCKTSRDALRYSLRVFSAHSGISGEWAETQSARLEKSQQGTQASAAWSRAKHSGGGR